MDLYNGRPTDVENRSEKELECYSFLKRLDIDFKRVDHQAADTMDVCLNIEITLGAPICKNLFLCNRQQTEFYLLMMPGDKPFKTKDLSAQIESSRLSFANAENMEKYLGTTPGSVSVLGLMNDTEAKVKLLIDEDILKSEFFGCHPCVNTSSLRIKVSDLIEKIIPDMKRNYIKVKL